MGYLELTPEEKFVYEWQKGMSGSFSTALAELICKADLGNQRMLAKSYPDAVSGVQKFQSEAGWWEYVKRIGEV